MEFAPIPEILDELRAGRFIVLVDDPQRENEGDVILAADKVTPTHVNFMLTHCRGEVCTTLPRTWAERLELPLQAAKNTSPLMCAKCVTVDAAHGATTGVSASDQALAIAALADPNSKPSDFNRPGHTRPIRSRDGGVHRPRASGRSSRRARHRASSLVLGARGGRELLPQRGQRAGHGRSVS